MSSILAYYYAVESLAKCHKRLKPTTVLCSCLQLVTVDPGNIDGAIQRLARNKLICLCCHKTFSQKSDARKHMRVVHLKEKKFVCEFCGQKSATNYNHKKHLQVCKTKRN